MQCLAPTSYLVQVIHTGMRSPSSWTAAFSILPCGRAQVEESNNATLSGFRRHGDQENKQEKIGVRVRLPAITGYSGSERGGLNFAF